MNIMNKYNSILAYIFIKDIIYESLDSNISN